MKIATLNIDWGNKQNSTNHFLKIEEFLNNKDFDFLILTEGINLNLQNFKYKYFSEQIPENIEYEKLNYTEYLKGEKAFRTILYSKVESKEYYKVSDSKTGLAVEFETKYGNVLFYCTIIGTRYKEKPFAKKELENFIKDSNELYELNQNLIIVGDLNTSFLIDEKDYVINKETTDTIKKQLLKLNLYNATEKIKKNIDHIILPKKMNNKIHKSEVFVEKAELSDHQGVYIELKQ